MWRDQELRTSANPLRQLFDACVQGYNLRLACLGCRRHVVLSRHAVWWHFRRKGWSEWLRDVPKRFRGRLCDRRGPSMDLVREEPTDASLPMPSETEWKRELSRRR